METGKPSGLGRGLAGILGDALTYERAPEVSNLLGIRSTPEVRKLATSLALTALAEGFGAEGVVVVSRAVAGSLATVASRLPEGWSGLDAEGFELAGRLWAALGNPDLEFEQLELGELHLLICRQQSAAGPLAAAMVRPSAFDDQEQRLVARLVRSVALAVNGGNEVPADASIRVLAKEADDGVLADATHRQFTIEYPYRDYDAFFAMAGGDALIDSVATMLSVIDPNHRIVLMTARPDWIADRTLAWVEEHNLRWDLLIMRGWGDYSPSREYKRRSLNMLRQVGFDVQLALDDDRRNVAMFETEGVPCVYIHSGYFD